MREDTWGKQTTAVVDANGGDAYACHTATVLALNTAMRKDEIRLLRWGQVDFEKRTLVVGRSKTEAGTGRLLRAALAFEVVRVNKHLCPIKDTS
jgi:integrase